MCYNSEKQLFRCGSPDKIADIHLPSSAPAAQPPRTSQPFLITLPKAMSLFQAAR